MSATKEMREIYNPTRQTYNEFEEAYGFFNRHCFDRELPPCLITLQRQRKSYGYFSRERWTDREGTITDEIAINPAFFSGRSVDEVLSTLVHEMVHLWQNHFGKPGRGGYHNREWASKMIDLGLHPSSTGLPGGKVTGDSVSHYIMEQGPFARAVTFLTTSGLTISWLDQVTGGAPKTKGGNRVKYTCPECNLNAWARPAIVLLCGACQEELQPQW